MTTQSELKESKVYNFLDEQNNFSIRFLEGQKIIRDLALIHDVKNKGFVCFRDLTLTTLHLCSYLKHNESLGIFVDGENPKLRYKVEIHESGTFRTLLLPETFDQLPESLNGIVRLVKMLPNNPKPYSSFIDLNHHAPQNVANALLEKSYQVQSQIFLGQHSDQSLLISKLPMPGSDKKAGKEDVSLERYLKEQMMAFREILDMALMDDADIMNQFQKRNLTFLHSKEMKFHCPCSQEQMESGVASLCLTENLDQVFENDQTLETRCDYCKTYYYVEKETVRKATQKS